MWQWFLTHTQSPLDSLLYFPLLQENFEVFLPFEDYSSVSLVADLREQHIRTHEVAMARHKGTAAEVQGPSTRSKLHRQALALQVSEQELEAELTLRALRDGNVRIALNKCR